MYYLSGRKKYILEHGSTYAKIAKNRQPWHGFTLQKNHIFGEINGTDLFVLKSINKERQTYIIYKFVPANTYTGYSEPHIASVYINSKVGKVISEALKARGGAKVDYGDMGKEVRKFYHPQLTRNYKFTPFTTINEYSAKR